jgi:hypothetical protein
VLTMKLRAISHLILFAIAVFPALATCAQEEKTTKGTLRFDFMVPQPISNGAFKKSFTGILDIGTGVYLNVKSVVLGVNGRYKQFQVPANKINNTITTMQSVYNGGISLGWDHFRSEKTLFTPGLNIGYNWMQFSRITCQTETPGQKNYTGVNLEPFFKIDWMIDDGFGIGVMASYNVLNWEFNPDAVCLNEFKTFYDKDYHGLTQSFSFGFCAYYDWSKRPKSEY